MYMHPVQTWPRLLDHPVWIRFQELLIAAPTPRALHCNVVYVKWKRQSGQDLPPDAPDTLSFYLRIHVATNRVRQGVDVEPGDEVTLKEEYLLFEPRLAHRGNGSSLWAYRLPRTVECPAGAYISLLCAAQAPCHLQWMDYDKNEKNGDAFHVILLDGMTDATVGASRRLP